MSIFRRKKSSKNLNSASAPSSPSQRGDYSPPLPPKDRRASSTQVPSSEPQRLYVDDFGRPVGDRPAFGRELNGTGPPRAFGTGYGVGDDEPASELQLLFGYTPVETTIELPVQRVEELVNKVATEIRTRGLDTPLILSSLSLDLFVEGSCSLIRSYLADMQAWARDLQLADPLAVGSFLKWGLARLVNDRGGRGFVSWELYNDFKASERTGAYPLKHVSSSLIARLTSPSARLLTTLLSLFSSIAAHSKANGMPPRKLASLFSPYIFGLADDETFDRTYEEWQRATDATEHLLLAFIRDQRADGPLPTHLEKYIVGYPQILNINHAGAPKVPKGARVEEVTRVRRTTRFHSRNLIASAGTWDVPHSPDWSLFFPLSHSHALAVSGAPPASIYSPHYRHLLNIRSNSFVDDGDEFDDGDMQRYKSVVEKSWSKFGELGFKDVEPSKLEFDLSEGERNAPKIKRETMDWSTFADSGFSGRDTFTSADLIFHQSINTTVKTWPASQQAINAKLREAEKALPAFPYDTTPHEEGRVLVDSLFFEAWADVLVSGGWARDELKESSFALIQWKSRPRAGEIAKGRAVGSDERTEDRWVLVEEFVPKEYREELLEGKSKKPSKRISFMRAVRRRSTSAAPPPIPVARQLSVSHPHHSGNGASIVSVPYASTASRLGMPLRSIDESVFSPSGQDTKVVSLSHLNLATNNAEYRRASTYAPSVSTTGAGHGHDMDDASRRGASPELGYMGDGIGGTLSSQGRDLHSIRTNGNGVKAAPVGFTKPQSSSKGAGFLARISSRRIKPSNNEQLTPVSDLSQGMGASTESFNYEQESRGPTFAHDYATGAPNLGPVAGSPSSHHTPQFAAPPHAHNSQHATPVEPSPISTSHDSEVEDDPYGGMDDDAEEVNDTIAFRGSQVYPARRESVGVLAPNVGVLAPNGLTQPQPQLNVVPPVSRPSRHDSLPPSPKPDAEVPVDEEYSARNDRYLSGASDYTSRVSKIVGLYENRADEPGAGSPPSPGGPVRLTQFGFGQGSGVGGGRD